MRTPYGDDEDNDRGRLLPGRDDVAKRITKNVSNTVKAGRHHAVATFTVKYATRTIRAEFVVCSTMVTGITSRNDPPPRRLVQQCCVAGPHSTITL